MRLTEPSGAKAEPLEAAEFAGLMDALGPFGRARRVVVGVSGGADSMALAWLLRGWGAPLGVVVDHGLRPASGEEAAWTLRQLARIGVPARVLRLRLASGGGMGARARAARYDALLGVCAAEGLPDLLVAHHQLDQVETMLLRSAAGSGPAGLAGMPAVRWCGAARLLRPLLGIAPGRLRATLRAAALPWVEDPGNTDPATARGALRQRHPAAAVPPGAAMAGERRRRMEQAVAAELAAHVLIHPEGYAELSGDLGVAAWSSLVWTVSGRDYPPPLAGIRRLAAAGQGTLHGVLVRRGLVMREPAAMQDAVPAVAGAVWDGRFRLGCTVEGATFGALGDDAARFRRRSGLGGAVLRTLPAVRSGGNLLTVPHLAYPKRETCLSVHVGFRPARALGGAAFAPAIASGCFGGCLQKGMHMGQCHPMS